MDEQVKKKYAFWLNTDAKRLVENSYKKDNCQSQSEFVENAIRFYAGYISRGKNDPSHSLQMMERPLMIPDELKNLPKDSWLSSLLPALEPDEWVKFEEYCRRLSKAARHKEEP